MNLATSLTFQFTEAPLILQFLSTCQKSTEGFPGPSYEDTVIKLQEKAQTSAQMTSEEIFVTDKPRSYLLYFWWITIWPDLG